MIDCGHSIAGEESRLQKALFGLVSCACLYASPTPTGTAAAQAITVGATSSTSDAPIFIADHKGYFRDKGLDVKVTNFRSAADMVAPLGAGQIEAGAGSASAGLYNAVARGTKIKIVADKASSPPGYGATKILVRKDHIESGRYRFARGPQGHEVRDECPRGEQYVDAQHPLAIRWAEIFRRRDRRSSIAGSRRRAQEQIGRRLGVGGAWSCARNPQRRCGPDQIRRRNPAEPPDRGPALFGGVRIQARRCRPTVHARLHPCRPLLQWRAPKRPARRTECGRCHCHPVRGDADQGPRYL